MEGITGANLAGKAELTPEMRQAGADESWWQAVSAKLEREEYAARSTEQGLQAPNRAQNLRTTFGEQGIEVLPRTAKGVSPAWRFGWQTTGFGRLGRIEEVSPSSPSSAGARVVYQRNGWSEWYENAAKGLVQGFTIERQPVGEGPIEIAGTFPAELHPRAREDGAVDFLDESEACVIRYGELHVWDAKGADVPADLVVAGSTLAIQIDDQGAEYPLVVDPLMTSPAWAVEGNRLVAQFGYSVGTAGDVNGDGFSDIIVGANGYDNGQESEGRAYVFLGSAAGLATTAGWITEGNQVFASFGNSVGTAGDVNGDGFSDVIVGALFITNGPNIQGAFVYLGSASGLGTSPAWIAEDPQGFGAAVGTAGDVNGDGFDDVLVGSPDYDNGQTDEGRAFLYLGSAGGLGATPAWTTESNQALASYGYSLSTAGDVNADGFDDVIVGAYQYDNANQPNQGRAFLYLGSGAGLGTTAVWTAESGLQASNFGRSVGNAGDVDGDGYADVIVGAPGYTNGHAGEGRAYVFKGMGAGLAAAPAWTVESDQTGAAYGYAVATAGDVNGDGYSDVIIGANLFDHGQNNEGRAYVYLGSSAGLEAIESWAHEVDQGQFGASVGSAGDVNGDGYSDVIVGAWNFSNGQPAEGAAFVYHGSAASVAFTEAWNQFFPSGSGFGASVANAGDVNGDGYSDVVVGAPHYANGEPDEGRAYVYHGSAAGLATIPAWTAESNTAGALLGTSVANAGDVNGDGYSDVVVGAPYLANGEQDEGRAYVYHGSAAGLAPTPAWTTESNGTSARFGSSVASAGDVNGDGFSDIIVGAPLLDNGQQDEGRAYVYHGSAVGLVTTPAWTVESNQVQLNFGTSVASAGDVNGDGYSDVIIGAPGGGSGRASVYHGSANGLLATASWTMNEYVFMVASAGDVNGDGFSDIIVGAFTKFLACLGSASGLGTTPAWTVNMDSFPPSVPFQGLSLATAGDVNADGYSDVIIGLKKGTFALPPITGLAAVYHGSATGLPISYSWRLEFAETGFGASVATAGDVNGDGYSDIIVGNYLSQQFSSGASCFLGNGAYLRNPGDGVDRIARQVRTDDSAPIWPLGTSDSESGFRLKALGRTPAGRGKVRVQYEIKPAGVPFDGAGLISGLAADTGVPGADGSFVPLSALASGLIPETLYHWRLRILTDSPFSPRSPWLWLPYNAATEADVRTKESTTAVGGEEPHPTAGLLLAPGAPNPFNPRTTLSFLLPARTSVRLAIHDVQGRLVRVLVDEVLPAGQHAVEWDGRDGRGQELATGVYLSRLEAGGEVRSQKLALVK
jgi:hypothetical protein